MLHFGALEAGGTKMVCAVGNAQGQILERISLPTRDPENTMPEILAFFREKQVSAVGVGCFGPVDLDRNSPTYGNITSSPKLQWRNFPHTLHQRRSAALWLTGWRLCWSRGFSGRSFWLSSGNSCFPRRA